MFVGAAALSGTSRRSRRNSTALSRRATAEAAVATRSLNKFHVVSDGTVVNVGAAVATRSFDRLRVVSNATDVNVGAAALSGASRRSRRNSRRYRGRATAEGSGRHKITQ